MTPITMTLHQLSGNSRCENRLRVLRNSQWVNVRCCLFSFMLSGSPWNKFCAIALRGKSSSFEPSSTLLTTFRKTLFNKDVIRFTRLTIDDNVLEDDPLSTLPTPYWDAVFFTRASDTAATLVGFVSVTWVEGAVVKPLEQKQKRTPDKQKFQTD